MLIAVVLKIFSIVEQTERAWQSSQGTKKEDEADRQLAAGRELQTPDRAQG